MRVQYRNIDTESDGSYRDVIFASRQVQPIFFNLTATLTSKSIASGSYETEYEYGILYSPKRKYSDHKDTTKLKCDRKFRMEIFPNTFIKSIQVEANPKRIVIFCTSLTDCGIVFRDIGQG